jgi:leader peptidase (prepilin peptidase)/N-methyltransferase
LSLLWLGLLANMNGAVCGSLQSAVIGALVGYLVLWLVYWFVKLITNKDGMGYGDFKFFAAILAWFGYQWFAPILLMATFLGISYYVVGRFLGKIAPRGEIPFGTFLGVSAIIVVFLSKYYIILPFTFSLQ